MIPLLQIFLGNMPYHDVFFIVFASWIRYRQPTRREAYQDMIRETLEALDSLQFHEAGALHSPSPLTFICLQDRKSRNSCHSQAGLFTTQFVLHAEVTCIPLAQRAMV